MFWGWVSVIALGHVCVLLMVFVFVVNHMYYGYLESRFVDEGAVERSVILDRSISPNSYVVSVVSTRRRCTGHLRH